MALPINLLLLLCYLYNMKPGIKRDEVDEHIQDETRRDEHPWLNNGIKRVVTIGLVP